VPVDLLKLQQQVSVGAAPSTLSLAASIVRREGPLGLYRGTRVTLLRDVPSSGVYFAAYELLNAELPRRTGCSDTAATFVAGGAAGVLSWLSIYPLDVVKSRLQAQPGHYSGLLDCLKRSVAEEGLGVLSRGLTACLLRAFVVNAAIFSGVEASRTLLSGRAI
jgi:solute carrier family 25 carnitine/acylcarnitine transporter 20/29